MKYLLPLVVLISGCSLLWDSDDDYLYSPAYALSVTVSDIRDHTVTFNYVGSAPSVCHEYTETRVDRDGTAVTVDLRFRVLAGTACIALAPPPFERSVSVHVAEPGAYTFRFPAGPSDTIDLEVTVP